MSIKTINDFVDWTKKLKGHLMLYRGLSDADMALEASGYRRIKTEEEPFPPTMVFHNYIIQLLERANRQGFRKKQGNNLSDLELLAELQHNGAATCLIDFTKNPLIALWFACQDGLGNNGKVVAMATGELGPTSGSIEFAIVDYDKSVSNNIMEFFGEEKLWKWIPAHQNNRIVAQNSVFVFGKEKIVDRYYETIEIEKRSKGFLIRELKDKFGIDEEYLFSDFSGFALANAHNKPYSSYMAEDYFSFGLQCNQRAEREKAIEYYSKAIKLNPEYAIAYNNLGNTKRGLSDYPGAMAAFDKAIELNPNYAKAYYNRGNAKSGLGDYPGAIADYDIAIVLNPKFPQAYSNRGSAKSGSGDHQGAIVDFDKAIELNPQSVEAYNNRGLAKSYLGDHTDAIADYGKAIELNPQSFEPYNNRGNARSDLGDYPDAIADYDKAIELNSEYTKAYNNRGIAKRDSGDHTGAIADYDIAIELNPEYAKAYNNRGLAKRDSDDHQGAREDRAKAIELDPSLAER